MEEHIDIMVEPVASPPSTPPAAPKLGHIESVYVHLMCLIAVALIGIGAAGSAVALGHMIAPSAAHRDNIDRVVVGVSNIADKVINDLTDQQQQGQEQAIAEYCDGSDMPEDECAAQFTDMYAGDFSTAPMIPAVIKDIRDEVNSQIRMTAFGSLMKALAAAGVGLVLFKAHRKKTAVYAGS